MLTEPTDLLMVCEQEKLHFSNAIQSFGVLAIVDKSLTVTHISTNLHDYLGINAQDALGQSLGTLFSSHFDIENALPFGPNNRKVIHNCKTVDGNHSDIVISETGNGWIIELQPGIEDGAFVPTPNHYLPELAQPALGSDLDAYIDTVAKIMSQVTGFAKVMIYKFHPDWSGEVISEYGGDEYFDRYLGLRFPASDIPKIARDLYLKTPYRLICDVNAETAPLIGTDHGQMPVNLTYSDLRSVSPVHIAYLKNMNVGASLSFPIVISGKLWGLVACHHPDAKYLAPVFRFESANIANIFTLSLRGYMAAERMALIDSLDHKINDILKQVTLEPGKPLELDNVAQSLLSLADASSGALFIGSEVTLFGETLEEEIVRSINYWASKNISEPIFHTISLPELIPEANGLHEKACGMLMMHARARDPLYTVRLFWFRAELPQKIHWAGNPEKRMAEGSGDLPVMPRASFEKWTELTRGLSSAWTTADQLMAAKFRASIIRDQER